MLSLTWIATLRATLLELCFFHRTALAKNELLLATSDRTSRSLGELAWFSVPLIFEARGTMSLALEILGVLVSVANIKMQQSEEHSLLHPTFGWRRLYADRLGVAAVMVRPWAHVWWGS